MGGISYSGRKGSRRFETNSVDKQRFQTRAQQFVEVQEELQQGMRERVEKACEPRRELARCEESLIFAVDNYVLVMSVRQQGRHPKRVNTWTRPWHTMNDNKEYGYAMQHVLDGETRDVHVCMRFYAAQVLKMTRPTAPLFQQIDRQREYQIWGIKDVRKTKTGDKHAVWIQRGELDKVENHRKSQT